MSIFDHLEELRQRIFVSIMAVGAAMLGCFAYSKELIMLLEAPVREQGVRFLQLAPGEFFFTTLKVSQYLLNRVFICLVQVIPCIYCVFWMFPSLHPGNLVSFLNNECIIQFDLSLLGYLLID